MAALAGGLGVQHLDHLLGPVPRGATIALVNDPGVEAEPFLYQAAHTHLRGGGEVVYVVLQRAPGAVRDGMREYGLAPQGAAAGRLLFVDGFSGLMGAAPDGPYGVDASREPGRLAEVLERAAVEHPDALLVVDALSTLADQTSVAAVASAMPRLQAAMRRFRLAVALVTRWPYPDPLDPLLAAFQGVVTLRGVQERVLFRQYFAVERAPGAPAHDSKPRLYRAMKPGGVVVYVPKIVVTGPHNAGKTTFIHAVSDSAVSAEALGTTVAMDHGQVTVGGIKADLFGTPGQARFDPIIKLLAQQALGVIVVVDATDPDTFPRAREILLATWKQGLPATLVANKQDRPGALPPDRVALLVGAPEHLRVLGASGQDPASARRVLQDLLERVLSAGSGVTP